MPTSNHDILRKRLLWRATHRGIKEMDILVGGYARAHLNAMDELDLLHFEHVLEFPDQDLLAWATKQESIPEHLQSAMLVDILRFRPENS